MSDPWEPAVLAYVAPYTHITTQRIMRDVFHWHDPAAWTMARCKRIGKILRQHGWEHAPWRDANGQLVKGYQRRLQGVLQDRRHRESRNVTPVGVLLKPALPVISVSLPPADPPCPPCRRLIRWYVKDGYRTCYGCGGGVSHMTVDTCGKQFLLTLPMAFNPTATLLERTLPAQGFMDTSKAAFPHRLRPQTRDSTWANLVNALK